jgi:small-conductance mechanosensitive channel
MEILGLNTDQWAKIGVSALVVLGAGLISRLLLGLILDRTLGRVFGMAGPTIRRTVYPVLRSTLNLVAILVAVNVAQTQLADLLSPRLQATLDNLLFAAYVVVGFVFATRLLSGFANWYSEEVAPKTETELDEQLIPFVRRIGLIVVAAIALIVMLSRFDVDVSGMVATLGIGSLAIALAAQASLADTISGFMIMIDRPYRINDRIEILDLDTWGDVSDIGLRSTRIRTRDNRMVIVPNSVMARSLIVNHSYPDTQYRIQIEIGIEYGVDIEVARRTMIDAIRGVEGVLEDKKVEALFLHFGESALNFRLRWWLESYIDTRRMFDRVNTAVYNALAEAGIEIPMTQREVHHKIDQAQTRQIIELVRG